MKTCREGARIAHLFNRTAYVICFKTYPAVFFCFIESLTHTYTHTHTDKNLKKLFHLAISINAVKYNCFETAWSSPLVCPEKGFVEYIYVLSKVKFCSFPELSCPKWTFLKWAQILEMSCLILKSPGGHGELTTNPWSWNFRTVWRYWHKAVHNHEIGQSGARLHIVDYITVARLVGLWNKIEWSHTCDQITQVFVSVLLLWNLHINYIQLKC